MSWFLRIALSAGILAMLTLALAAHYYYKGFYRPAPTRPAPTRPGHDRPTPTRPTTPHAPRPASVSASSFSMAAEHRRLAQKAAGQKAYLSRFGFNADICFFADMRIPSGKNRFFVYDLHKDSVLLAGLVAHGCGSSIFSGTPTFSNANGSNCTSLGKYRIGFPYRGQFGLAYKLYGLENTNDQAFSRNIVLHAYTAMPSAETYPYPICNSRGCPMVSTAFLQQLQPVIDRSKKPIVLWIFD